VGGRPKCVPRELSPGEDLWVSMFLGGGLGGDYLRTDRHGRAHKVFSYTKAQRTPKHELMQDSSSSSVVLGIRLSIEESDHS
jgi:hypothetical protein